MPQVSLAKGTVNLEVVGQGPTPLTFIHGLGPGASSWELVTQGLPDGWRALAPDLPGFGDTERGGFGGDIDAAATVVHHTLHAFGQLSAGALIGHGYGALVALSFTSRYPSHVDRLVLIDSGAFVRDVAALAIWHDDVLGHGWDAERAEAWLKSGLVETLAEPHFAAMRDATAKLDADLVAGCLAAMMRAELLEAARSLRVPLLLIRGEQDPQVSDDDLAILSARAPDVTLETIPATGHWPHLEAPDELRSALRRFIDPTAESAAKDGA
jgi:sigma-B regulation protein RsbQ